MQNAKTKPLSNLDSAAFCTQLSMLLDGGVSVHESLLILHESTKSSMEATLFADLAQRIEHGAALNQAMSQNGRFLRYTIEMVRIGENTGRLIAALNALSDYYRRQERLRQTIKAAITHPLVLLCLLFALVAVLLVRILPVFSQVYAQLGADMSPFAARLLSFGQWLSHGCVYIGIAAVFLAMLLYCMWRSEKGRDRLTGFLHHIPFLQPLMQQITTNRFSFAMALMLKSGLPFDQAAVMSAELFRGSVKTRLKALISQLNRNAPLAEILAKSNLFTAVDARLLQVGARVGALDNAMEDLARRSQAQSDVLFERTIGIVEPTLVALMALVAGMVLLSVMLPLLGIMSMV